MLPTYEECVSITKQTSTFIEKKVQINGFNVSIFNYFLATYEDFEKYKANELRGLTFVEASPGHKTRFLHLHKFFNINQVESTQLHEIKDKKIVNVKEKADGSMITFITLPDGAVYAKTKMSFENDQAEMAQKLFDESIDLQRFVSYCYGRQLHPVFELTSPHNKIVLNYGKTELQLLQIRNSEGKYLEHIEMFYLSAMYNIKTVKPNKETDLNAFVKAAETLEDIEGWVIRFNDGQMIKVKTAWYFNLHGLLTNDLVREDFIIKNTLEETIDDVMSQVDEKDPRREWVQKVSDAIGHYVANTSKDIKNVLKSYNGSNKDFALANRDYKYFGVCMYAIKKGINDENIEKFLVEKILKDTNGLEKGRKFLIEEVKFTVPKI